MPLCGTKFIVSSRTKEGQVGANCTQSAVQSVHTVPKGTENCDQKLDCSSSRYMSQDGGGRVTGTEGESKRVGRVWGVERGGRCVPLEVGLLGGG